MRLYLGLIYFGLITLWITAGDLILTLFGVGLDWHSQHSTFFLYLMTTGYLGAATWSAVALYQHRAAALARWQTYIGVPVILIGSFPLTRMVPELAIRAAEHNSHLAALIGPAIFIILSVAAKIAIWWYLFRVIVPRLSARFGSVPSTQ